MSAACTPTPWKMSGKSVIRSEGGDRVVGDIHWRNRDANAEFIIRAVNSHEEFVGLLREIGDWLKEAGYLEIHQARIAAALAKSGAGK